MGWRSLLILCVFLGSPDLRAADTEQREFSILIDGKEAGLSRMTITVQDDGTTVVAANLQVRYTHLFLNYNLAIEATEWWKDGKLTGLKSVTTENSKRVDVVIAGRDNKLQAQVNGKERAVAPDIWASSFWKLPDARFHNKSIPVFEPDSGRDYLGQLQFVGTEQLTVLNQPQNCYHFRVTGGSYPVDVWFDRYHRLVRQEFTESGHKTIVQLIALKR